jgi:hypothetical protein
VVSVSRTLKYRKGRTTAPQRFCGCPACHRPRAPAAAALCQIRVGARARLGIDSVGGAPRRGLHRNNHPTSPTSDKNLRSAGRGRVPRGTANRPAAEFAPGPLNGLEAYGIVGLLCSLRLLCPGRRPAQAGSPVRIAGRQQDPDARLRAVPPVQGEGPAGAAPVLPARRGGPLVQLSPTGPRGNDPTGRRPDGPAGQGRRGQGRGSGG